jgi:drug/metabolite transporter (DMT)-like permease
VTTRGQKGTPPTPPGRGNGRAGALPDTLANVSLVLAVPLGVAAAVVYGTSIVVQHRTAQEHAEDGQTSAASLWRLAQNPLWLVAVISDFLGFALQAAALSVGAVVVVQPLVVLMLPVALFVSFLMGGHRPRGGDYLGVLAVLGGLAVFLALIGKPGDAQVPAPKVICLAVLLVLVGGVLLCAVVTGRNRIVRGAMYGTVAGVYFGTLAVLVDAGSSLAGRQGVQSVVTTHEGLVCVAGIVLLGAAGIILTQMSFQIGALGATLPANLAADPLAGVFLGAALLHEHIALSTPHCIAYVLCLIAVVAGAIRLADPHVTTVQADAVGSKAA